MKTTLTIAATLMLTAATSSWAVAQTTGGFFPPSEAHRYYQSPPTYYHHASTEAEGYLRGAADVIRARGENAYNRGLAANLFQEAYTKSLKNRELRAQTYFAMRELNRSQRFPQVDPAEAAARRERVSQWGRAARLSTSQFRAELGQLIWPDVLRDPMFDNERREIDLLVRQSIAGYGAEITTLVHRLEDRLGDNYHTFGQESYLSGSRFLKSLLREVREAKNSSGALAMAAAR